MRSARPVSVGVKTRRPWPRAGRRRAASTSRHATRRGFRRTRLRGSPRRWHPYADRFRQCGRVRPEALISHCHATRCGHPPPPATVADRRDGAGNRVSHRVGASFAWRRNHRGRRTPVARSSSPCSPSKISATQRMSTSPTVSPMMCARSCSKSKASRSSPAAVRNEYNQTKKSQQQIARELGVDYLLTGTVQWEKAAQAQAGYTSHRSSSMCGRATLRRAAGDDRSTPRSPMRSRCRPISPDRWSRRSTWPSSTAPDASWRWKPTRSLPAYEAFLRGRPRFRGMSA